MKKIMTYLFLVMITMTGTLTTACSSSDDAGDGTLTATWEAGDEVKVYEGETLLGTLRPQTTGSRTTKLTGELDAVPSASGVTLTLKYKETDYSGQKSTCTVGSAVHSNLSKKTGSDTSYTWHLTT
jgi:hypothetical protein